MDEYEYAVKGVSTGSGTAIPVHGSDWMSREEAEKDLRAGLEENVERERLNRPVLYTYSLVRRKKPGPVEDVDTDPEVL